MLPAITLMLDPFSEQGLPLKGFSDKVMELLVTADLAVKHTGVRNVCSSSSSQDSGSASSISVLSARCHLLIKDLFNK